MRARPLIKRIPGLTATNQKIRRIVKGTAAVAMLSPDIANGEETLVKEEENPKEEKSDPEASEADTDLLNISYLHHVGPLQTRDPPTLYRQCQGNNRLLTSD